MVQFLKRGIPIILVGAVAATQLLVIARGRPDPIPARAAAALEFYSTETETLETESTATYNTYLSLEIDRSAQSSSKDFFIFASITTTVDNTAASSSTRLVHATSTGTTTLREVNNGFSYYSTSTAGIGKSFEFVDQVTLSTSTTHFISLQFANTAATNNVEARAASIIALEVSAGAQYAENTSETCTGASTGVVSAFSLTFTPAAQDGYIFVWAVERKAEDDDDLNALGITFSNTTDTQTYAAEGITRTHNNNANNDNVYYTAGGVATTTVEASSHQFTVGMDGNGTADEVCVRGGAIVAIPFADFENVYHEGRFSNTFSTHDGTSLSDTAAATSSRTVNAAKHLVLGGLECANEAGLQSCQWSLTVGADEMLFYNTAGKDSDNSQLHLGMLARATTTTATTTQFRLQGASTLDGVANQGESRKAYLVVAQIPAAANSAPSISSATLNSGNSITLTEESFVIASTTITVTDANTCQEINFIEAKLYHAATTSAGTTCANNDNDCYDEFIACTATTTGNTCSGPADTSVQYDCSFRLWYIAEPTDAGSPDAGDVWLVAATTSDGQATTTATNTGQTIEVNTLNALSVTDTIAHGTVNPGANTGATTQSATSTNTGNAAIDNEISGNTMCTNFPTCSGASSTKIHFSQQKFATSSLTYASLTFTLATTASPATIELDLAKPTATGTAVNDPTFWGIAVPLGVSSGVFTGRNVFTAIAD